MHQQQQPSICIPRLTDDASNKAFILKVFNRYNWGSISRVDVVNKNGNSRAFIHFKSWHNTPRISAIRKRFLNGEIINIIYHKPWFWKCSASRIPKPL